MIKYKYIQALACFTIVTLAIFLYYDHFNEHPVKQKYYYIWDKVKDLLFIVAVTWLIPVRWFVLKIVFFVLSIFFLIRVIWQLWEMEDYIAANKPYVIDILFGVLMLIALILSILPEKFYVYLKNKLWPK